MIDANKTDVSNVFYSIITYHLTIMKNKLQKNMVV